VLIPSALGLENKTHCTCPFVRGELPWKFIREEEIE
jgi:hypothetical protein